MRILLIVVSLLFFSACKRNGEYCKELGNKSICQIFDNDTLREIQTYNIHTKDIRDGYFMKFSNCGDTLLKSCYKNNVLIGSYYEFYKKGYPKKYICFDSFNEDTMYYCEYNISRKIIKESGEFIYGKGYTGLFDGKLKKDSIVEIMSVVVAVPFSYTTVTCYAINNESLDTVYGVNKYFEPRQNNLLLTTQIKLLALGKYQVYALTTFYDSLRKKVYSKKSEFAIDF